MGWIVARTREGLDAPDAPSTEFGTLTMLVETMTDVPVRDVWYEGPMPGDGVAVALVGWDAITRRSWKQMRFFARCLSEGHSEP